MKTSFGVCGVAFVLLAAGGCSDGSPPPAVGTLARDRLELVAEAFEPVIARPVAEGSFVEAGDVLVELDPTRQRARVAQSEQARERAKARLSELLRGPREERLVEARARLRGAEGRLTTARRDLERARELESDRVVSTEQLDRQGALFDEALAARDAARAMLDALEKGTTEEQLAQALAAEAEAEARLEEAQVRLERLVVRAPTAGWLDALPYELGEQPVIGGVVAVLLAQEAPYARVYVPAAIRARVKKGTRARVHVDGLEQALEGRVRTVAREASFTPYFALTERDRSRLVYLAKVDLDEVRARDLPTGFPVEVDFEIDSSDRGSGDATARD